MTLGRSRSRCRDWQILNVTTRDENIYPELYKYTTGHFMDNIVITAIDV